MFLGIFGGYTAIVFGGLSSSAVFLEGVQMDFIPFHIQYAFIKTVLFSFFLATIPAYHGYYLKGGALQVGKASTTSFVWTSIVIILANFIITQLVLA
jgi:phospholipid/cholesterol/gamma-HCH transport system permease protein